MQKINQWAKTNAATVRYVILFCAVYGVIVGLSGLFDPVAAYSDYFEYIRMSGGQMSAVHQPFAGRILAPLIARGLASVVRIDPARALSLTCATGWVALPLLAATLLRLRKVPLSWALVIASLPFPALSARFLFVPDAWPVCLVLTIFIAVERNQSALAGLGAAGLALTRTSSIVAVTLQAAARFNKKNRGAIALVFTAFVIGLLLKQPLIEGNAGNQHKISSVLYMVAKIPVNGIYNIFGFHIYTNTFPYCPIPKWTFYVGRIQALGSIKNIGLCNIYYKPIFTSFICYCFIFGLFPFLAAARLLKNRTISIQNQNDSWREPAVFLIVFLLSPTFGLTIPRLFVEAYPLLFTAAAWVASGSPLRPRHAAGLMAYNLAGLALLAHFAPN